MEQTKEELEKEIEKTKALLLSLERKLFSITYTRLTNIKKDTTKKVAAYMWVEEFELTGKSRKREIVRARKMLVLILRNYNITFQSVADYLWYHHSAVLHLYKQALFLLETDLNFEQIYNQINN